MLFLTFLLLYSIIIENERTTNLRIISPLRGREEDHERAGHESAERDDLHHKQGPSYFVYLFNDSFTLIIFQL